MEPLVVGLEQHRVFHRLWLDVEIRMLIAQVTFQFSCELKPELAFGALEYGHR